MSSRGDVVASYVHMVDGTLGLEGVTPSVRDVVVAVVLFSNIVLIAEDYAGDGDQDAVAFLRSLWLSVPCKPDAAGEAPTEHISNDGSRRE